MVYVRGIENSGITISLEGAAELESQLAAIGKLPKKAMTRAAKAGVNPIVSDAKARSSASSKTGMFVRGIRATQETPRKRNKSVYFIYWWKKYAENYVKPIKHVGLYGGKNSQGYYPMSVEWGFKAKGGKVQGKYYVRDAIAAHQASSLQKVMDTLSQEIDKLI